MPNKSNETLAAVQREAHMRSYFAQKIREFLMDEFNMNERDAQAVLDEAWKATKERYPEKKAVKRCSK